ncbi:DUF3299 domain-containing protein [Bowmanella sp. JS7-9]|uniref:DUF3299 domain-containing protein n=1 Tax=Pseudobowmanella zhangzhouensis TaxID=1537679 RepID=A0ABW1XM26_9ALTE|nr:DUF3299 domain-containing protein [Bowmanella sp. JS7-9]TBX21776.1 lipoprotein [Bowmanella sp. JS7-9]
MKNLFAGMLLSVFACGLNAAEPLEVYWEDLKPADSVLAEQSVDHSGSGASSQALAPVIDSFNGKLVKVPGFVVPLEGDKNTFSEILLVPYFGACIHVPPPPSNQIIYVKFAEPVPIDNLYDPIWVVGVLSTETWQGDIATTGYRLAAQTVELYQ